MTFVLHIGSGIGAVTLDTVDQTSTDWAFVGANGGDFTYVSNVGLTIAPGATSTLTVRITPGLSSTGSLVLATTLPSGIGGEANAANNSATHTATIVPPV